MERQSENPTSAGGAQAFGEGAGSERGRAPIASVVVPLAAMSPSDLDQPRYTLPPIERTDIEGPVWRWTVSVQGTCSRSSTTATDRRRDALLSATRFIEAAKRIVRFEPKRLDASIAHEPSTASLPSAVEGRYTLDLELRDADASTVVRVYERLTLEAWTIGRLSRTRFAFEPHRMNPIPSCGHRVADAAPLANERLIG